MWVCSSDDVIEVGCMVPVVTVCMTTAGAARVDLVSFLDPSPSSLSFPHGVDHVRDGLGTRLVWTQDINMTTSVFEEAVT